MPSFEDRLTDCIPNLRRYARALMRGDALAADDLVQDCLERALSRLHRWRAGSDLRAWLFTIMHNIHANQARRFSNGPKFVELTESNDYIPVSGDAEDQLKLRDLHRAITDLPPEQREILLLVSLEGLRYQDVANILGVPVGTVMSKLSRARKQLREIVNDTQAKQIRRVK